MFRMVRDETFRRVPQIHRSSRPPTHSLSRRDAETRSGVSKTGRRESQTARPETRVNKKAESSYAALGFGPRSFRYRLEVSFRFFCPLRRQFRIGQSLAYDLRTQKTKPISIVKWIIFCRSIVKTEHLFVNVTVEMERFDRNVRLSKLQKFSIPFV